MCVLYGQFIWWLAPKPCGDFFSIFVPKRKITNISYFVNYIVQPNNALNSACYEKTLRIVRQKYFRTKTCDFHFGSVRTKDHKTKYQRTKDCNTKYCCQYTSVKDRRNKLQQQKSGKNPSFNI